MNTDRTKRTGGEKKSGGMVGWWAFFLKEKYKAKAYSSCGKMAIKSAEMGHPWQPIDREHELLYKR